MCKKPQKILGAYESQRNIAIRFREGGQLDNARALFEFLLQSSPNRTNDQRADILVHLVITNLHAGNHKQALQDLEKLDTLYIEDRVIQRAPTLRMWSEYYLLAEENLQGAEFFAKLARTRAIEDKINNVCWYTHQLVTTLTLKSPRPLFRIMFLTIAETVEFFTILPSASNLERKAWGGSLLLDWVRAFPIKGIREPIIKKVKGHIGKSFKDAPRA